MRYVAAAFVVLMMLPIAGQMAWRRGSAARIRSLSAVADQRTAGTFEKTRLGAVPAPVVRFLSHVLTDGHPLIRTAFIEQAGDFRVGESWYPFRATQRFTVEPAG